MGATLSGRSAVRLPGEELTEQTWQHILMVVRALALLAPVSVGSEPMDRNPVLDLIAQIQVGAHSEESSEKLFRRVHLSVQSFEVRWHRTEKRGFFLSRLPC